ncbi:unnamed protein product [Fusarium equiseti]|uniref:Uncharacterized protein n=1 Tax=Fusarium equiseti TaxID=61235 RepID=A0A8J2J011_FUSEQ|nr:unnamed protein product [Fusarium equiseti]
MTKRKQQTPQTQLAFVIQTPSSNSTKSNAKLVRSHAARLPSSRKYEKQVKSWILKKEDKSTALQIPDGSIPGRVGTNLSVLDFPEPLKPYMENDMFRWFHGMRGTLYPQEICLQINALHSSWTTNLLIDKIYFHAVLFSIETYFNPQGTLSHFHFAKTLRLLQERLHSPDENAISDATIMVVVMLGLSAELIGDSGAAEKHVDGLKRIVELRGGLEGLRFDNPRLPAKVCRVDLGLVLRFGCEPVFFTKDDISWNPYLPPQVLMKKTTQHPEAFIKTLDPRLANVWKDLHEFSTLGNLAYQTDHLSL